MREFEYNFIQDQLDAIKQIAEKIKKEIPEGEIKREVALISGLITDVLVYLYEAHGFLSEEKQIYSNCAACRYQIDEPCRKCVNESEFRPIGDLTHSFDK